MAWGHSEQCRNSPDKQTVRCSRDSVEMKIHEAVGGQGVTGLVCGPVPRQSGYLWKTSGKSWRQRSHLKNPGRLEFNGQDELESEELPEESWQFGVQQPGWESQPWD